MLTVYEHETEGWGHQELGLASVRNRERPISLKQLRRATAQAEKLAKKMYMAYSKVRKSVVQNRDG